MEGGLRMNPELDDAGRERHRPSDRVRAHTRQAENVRVDANTQDCLVQHASAGLEDVGRHIDTLEREWDVERYLQMNAGLVSLSGVLLGALVDRRFLVLPAAVFGFFFQHATQGWCPPLPVFRRTGVRTRREINREKYALKALRGDFDAAALPPAAPEPR
jgi:hypothetical protein